MNRIKLLLITLLLFASQIAAAQVAEPYLNFTRLKDLPYSLVWPATVTDGESIYLINGHVSEMYGFSGNVFKYMPGNDSLTAISKEADYKIQVAAAYVPSNGHAYVFGGNGYRVRTVYRAVQSINMHTGVVSVLTNVFNPMPAGASWAAEWDNKIYLWGGSLGEHTLNTMYRFDPLTTTFTQLANMPQGSETTGAIVNGVLYTFGGYDQFTHLTSKNINAYHIKNDTWSKVDELPKAISASCIAVSGSLIFLIGNYDDETFLGYYNARTNSFTKLKSNIVGAAEVQGLLL